jgi:hypothetical protein
MCILSRDLRFYAVVFNQTLPEVLGEKSMFYEIAVGIRWVPVFLG